MKPFIFKYNTDNNKYIYDVMTNEILKVDEAVFNIIDHIYEDSEEEICRQFQPFYERRHIVQALAEINSAKQRGLFSKTGEAEIVFYSKAFVVETLQKHLAHLILNVTENCNLRCRYCIYSGNYFLERTHSPRNMDESVAFRAIDYFLEHGNSERTRIVGFYGGEPLLRFDLIRKCVEYIKKKSGNVVFSITTNGVLLNQNIIRYLIAENIGLAVSLDPPRKNHDQYRITADGARTYDHILSNLSLIKQEDQYYYDNSVVISTVLKSVQELEDIKTIVNGSNEFSGHTILFNYLIPFNNQLIDKQIVEKFDIDKSGYIRKFAQELIQGKSNRFYSFLLNMEYSKIHFRTRFKGGKGGVLLNQLCIPGATKLVVNTDGEFHFCTNLCSHMSIGDVRLGIDESKVFSIIDNYLNMSREECSKCWAVRLCDGCYVIAAQGNEYSPEQKLKVCPGIRKESESLLFAYSLALEKDENIFDFLKNPKPKRL